MDEADKNKFDAFFKMLMQSLPDESIINQIEEMRLELERRGMKTLFLVARKDGKDGTEYVPSRSVKKK